ncbi:DUF2637 domain-containing protein [Streptomyces sp. PH10-H1]|uniref:DUF2637 domain-containing protein n=1 Tax=Streptomyces sp. PH10-H1 TaxID=3046212 RepID=UPI0024B899BB|nr:DUF2637 domain-containing protein [Streptomyces sp. PH10-H1]MDJ0346265.1 DUF2637 domain-containing protein [Streptomyces sp. PH10-H1]
MNRRAKTLLVLALVVVVGMAFRVSWNALRDVARTIGADGAAATLYPFVVDGLMALALVATLVLTGDSRRFALRVLATYTLASLVLNYVHGLVPQLHRNADAWGRLADWGPANWALVLLATSLPVGSIYFGSDLVAKVLHHRPEPPIQPEEPAELVGNRSTPDLGESTPANTAQGFESPDVESAPTVEQRQESAPTVLVPVRSLAAAEPAPRRATGRVPSVARTPRLVRTADDLLSEARTATADWSDAALTGEAIRKAVRTSAANARALRDALRAERDADAPTAEAVS